MDIVDQFTRFLRNCPPTPPLTQHFAPKWEVLIGSLSNDDADGNENDKKAIGMISKTTTLHVHHAFFVHFFAAVARLQRESAWIHVLSRTVTQDNNFLFFSWTLIQSLRIQLQKHLPTFDESNEMD